VSDRDTAPLFADGAGAAVVAATDSPIGRIGPIALRSDPSGSQLIRLSRGDHIRMNGHESFRAAVTALSEVTIEALAASDVRLEDIDLFVYHEANSRIIRAVGQRLELPPDRVVDYIGRFANASTATLPIALSVAQSEGPLEPGAQVLLAAFGGGLTWGAAVAGWCAPARRRAT
jgi:3-oxoacyl-[acyl-carrier-protein] synthase-3